MPKSGIARARFAETEPHRMVKVMNGLEWTTELSHPCPSSEHTHAFIFLTKSQCNQTAVASKHSSTCCLLCFCKPQPFALHACTNHDRIPVTRQRPSHGAACDADAQASDRTEARKTAAGRGTRGGRSEAGASEQIYSTRVCSSCAASLVDVSCGCVRGHRSPGPASRRLRACS